MLIFDSSKALIWSQQKLKKRPQIKRPKHWKIRNYKKKSIKRKGLFLGILSGLNQLGNCSGSILKDYPVYKITPIGKINNTIE